MNRVLAWTRGLALVAAAAAACGSARAQSFNCYEGQGVLENAWNDWSWCTDDLQSSTYVYTGSYSVEVTYTGAWQAFSLESSTSFPAGYFTALSFVINGGTTAGRSIAVALVVNGAVSNAVNLNNYIRGGAITAGGWRQVSIPLSAFGVKPTDTISRFWLQESSGHAQPSFWIDQIDWTPAPPPSPVKVVVNGYTTLRAVDQKMFGVNTAVWDGNLAGPTCKGLIAQGGYKAFRFPGGSLSDGYHWATDTTDSNTWTWATDFDAFASVAVPATGGQCFITTNYGTGTPAEAAAWVRYSNVTKRYGMKYWEVGNECYGSWEEDSHTRANDPVIYANQFAQYYAAMKAEDPTIQVGAVASPGEDAYANYADEVVTNPRTGLTHSGWTAVMLSTLAGLGVTPDFIIYHRYPEYVTECDFTLLIGNSSWATDMADLRQQLRDYLGAANTQTQIMCTENNCDAGTPGKQLCSLVNGVFMADTFGTILQTECNSFLWWDLVNGQDTGGDNGSWLYGWRLYGDEGVFSPDFTQTYPVYYMEQLFNDFAAPGDLVMPVTSTYGLLSAYATRRTDGTARVMVVNKNPTATISAELCFAGFRPATTATVYSYGMPQDNAAKNGQAQVIGQSVIPNITNNSTLTFPPYSVTVLVFAPLNIGSPSNPVSR
ncbi:MAG: alpha-L-arabinofuranosidase [Fimbriimonadaceae bacterium]